MNTNYNLFIGWSGERSRLVAVFFRGWISKVIQSARPWMSETDIEKGSRGLNEIAKVLADIRVGITCLTPENLQRPWIFFEAGALSKTIGDRTRLCTYLIGGLEPQDVVPPLGMFQATKAVKEDTLKLVRTINVAVSENPVPEQDLDELFGAMWPKLEERLATLPPLEESIPAMRTVDDMVAEILEIVRTDSNRRSRADILTGIAAAGVSQPMRSDLMRITNLTFLAFYLNGALDTGKYTNVSFKEAADQIEAGTIFEFLKTRLDGDIDLSIFDESKQRELITEWQDLLAAVNARRKFGVEKNGICLLIAYLLEGIQRRQDNNPKI